MDNRTKSVFYFKLLPDHTGDSLCPLSGNWTLPLETRVARVEISHHDCAHTDLCALDRLRVTQCSRYILKKLTLNFCVCNFFNNIVLIWLTLHYKYDVAKKANRNIQKVTWNCVRYLLFLILCVVSVRRRRWVAPEANFSISFKHKDFSQTRRRCVLCGVQCRSLSLLPLRDMTWFIFPADNLLCRCLSIGVTVWLSALFVFIIVPAVLGVSFGIRRLYMRTLLKIFEVSLVSVLYCIPCQMGPLGSPSSEGLLEAQSTLSPRGVRF